MATPGLPSAAARCSGPLSTPTTASARRVAWIRPGRPEACGKASTTVGKETPGWPGLQWQAWVGVVDCPCSIRFGGPGEIRTHDLFHAMEARSQLRHRPIMCKAITRVSLEYI